MVKLSIEAAQSWKSFELWILLTETFNCCVTNSAERAALRVELRLMTVDALFVSGKSRLNGVVASLMADGATPTSGQSGVRARI